jgi:hypothetical protein
MMRQIWQRLTGALATLALILTALWQRERAQRAQEKAEAAEAQREQLIAAQGALRDAQEKGKADVEAMDQRVRDNDFGGLDNNW